MQHAPLAGRVRLAALGDSTGLGVGARSGLGYVARLALRLEEPLARRGITLEAANLCGSGATSNDVRARQLPRALALRPDVATVCVGGNDLWRGVSEARFADNVDAVVAALGAAGARVVLGTVPDISQAPVARMAESLLGVRPEDVRRRAEALAARVREVADRRGAVLFDLFELAGDRPSREPRLFCDDGFHPSCEGYEAWAEMMLPYVVRAIDAAGP